MNVAVLSDIHGNNYALEAVLVEINRLNIKKVLILGDIVGYYYHPDIVLKLLSKFDCEMIQGNHEMILNQLKNGLINENLINQKYGSGHKRAFKQLNENQLKFLFSLPYKKSIVINNCALQLNHGSPWDSNYYLYSDTDKKILERCNSLVHDFVLIGHSHYPFFYKCENSTLINVGSVGQSRKMGGIASWCLINTLEKHFELQETPYDISKLISEVDKFDPDRKYNRNILLRI